MSKVRERILETATEMFYRHGIQAVGVDAIIAGADVARMSFYRHFQSKEGLAVAVLQQRDEAIRSWFESELENLALPPEERPLAVFDILARRFADPDYRGCAFVNAIAEAADRSCAVHTAACTHKSRFQEFFANLLRNAGLDPTHAPDLMLLFDGAVVTAVREGTTDAAVRARKLAAHLIAS